MPADGPPALIREIVLVLSLLDFLSWTGNLGVGFGLASRTGLAGLAALAGLAG